MPLEKKYVDWIAKNVKDRTEAYGACASITRKMWEAFPFELRRVRGFYYCTFWGRREHWWLVDLNNNVVDPTASQFPSNGMGTYEELTDEEVEKCCPVGKCPNCGNELYKDNEYGTEFCNEDCANSYVAYVNMSSRGY